MLSKNASSLFAISALISASNNFIGSSYNTEKVLSQRAAEIKNKIKNNLILKAEEKRKRIRERNIKLQNNMVNK